MDVEKLRICVGKGMSISELALEFGCSNTNVRYWMTKSNLKSMHRLGGMTSDEDILLASQNVTSISSLLRSLDLHINGSSHAHMTRRVDALGIIFGTMAERVRGSSHQKNAASILVRMPSGSYRTPTYQLRRALIESGVPEMCVLCGQDPWWRGKPLVIQIDHKDGDGLNNQQENLRFLCPNCHTQTETYGNNGHGSI